jgi:hypothetical protein
VIKKLVLVFLLIGISLAVNAQSGEDVFTSAIGNYQNGRYDQALTEFRQLLLDPQFAPFRGMRISGLPKSLSHRIACPMPNGIWSFSSPTSAKIKISPKGCI